MNWKEHLSKLEQSEKFEEAISFMEKIIKDNPEEIDRFLFTGPARMHERCQGLCI